MCKCFLFNISQIIIARREENLLECIQSSNQSLYEYCIRSQLDNTVHCEMLRSTSTSLFSTSPAIGRSHFFFSIPHKLGCPTHEGPVYLLHNTWVKINIFLLELEYVNQHVFSNELTHAHTHTHTKGTRPLSKKYPPTIQNLTHLLLTVKFYTSNNNTHTQKKKGTSKYVCSMLGQQK